MKKVLAGLVALALVGGGSAYLLLRDSDDEEGRAATRRVENPSPRQVERIEVAEQPLPRKPGQVIVKYKPFAAPPVRADIRSELDARLIERLPIARTELLKLEPGVSVAQTIEQLEQQPQVEYAEPNYIYSGTAEPNDPRYAELWGLNNGGQAIEGASGSAGADIDALAAWDITTGSKSVTVAVVDSGIDYEHPDLVPNLAVNPGETGDGKETNGGDDDGNGFPDDWRGWDFVQNDNDPRDYHSHGTHVAGTIGAKGNDGRGVVGVSWDVSLLPVRVLGADNSGTLVGIGKGLGYAGKMGVDIANASLGGPPSQFIRENIEAHPNTLYVVAAGNNGNDNDGPNAQYPCAIDAPNIICVAATTPGDQLAEFSNYGAGSVDVAAPGTSILSSVPKAAKALEETFEQGLGGWVAEGQGAQWAPARDVNGGYVVSNPSGGYEPNSNTWIRNSQPFAAVGQRGCEISYWMLLDVVEQKDLLVVETSSDGTNWQPAKAWTGSTNNQWFQQSHPLQGIAGSSQAWVRFRLTSETGGEVGGASLDDVVVSCVGDNSTGEAYEFFQGTSMASPHVAGIAALLKAAAPDATVAQLKDAILGSVEPLPALEGKVSTGGRVNALQALQAINAG